MHDASPYGYLVIGRKIPTAGQLASLVGCEVDNVIAALAELEDAAVLSRDELGRIYSRRMVRDQEKAARDKANGNLGGNPQLRCRSTRPAESSEEYTDIHRFSDDLQRDPTDAFAGLRVVDRHTLETHLAQPDYTLLGSRRSKPLRSRAKSWKRMAMPPAA